MVALGLKGAPGIVTLATTEIVLMPANFSDPPILSMNFLNIEATVTSELISFLKTGLSIFLPYLSKYFTGTVSYTHLTLPTKA